MFRLSHTKLFILITIALSVQVTAAPLKILMIGNSYTNGSAPSLEFLLQSANIEYELVTRTVGGSTLETHAVNQYDNTFAAINSNDWDVVVLQGQSFWPAYHACQYQGSPEYSNQHTVESAEILANMIQANNPNTRIIWYATPAYKEGHTNLSFFQNDPLMMSEHINSAYHYFNNTFSPNGQVAEITDAFELSYTEDPTRNLHQNDKSHQNGKGKYLSACVLFETITGNSAIDLPKDYAFSEENKIALQTISQSVTLSNIVEWGPEKWEYDLVTQSLYPTTQQIGESGIVTGSQDTGAWYTITLNHQYNDPVIITGPVSFNGGDPVYPSIRNISGSGFEYQLQEFSYHGGSHNSETFTFAVVERGVFTLTDGAIIEAGTTTIQPNFSQISLNAGQATTPYIFTSIVSQANNLLIVPRINNITNNSFSYKFQAEEAIKNTWENADYQIEEMDFVALYNSSNTNTGILSQALGDQGVSLSYTSNKTENIGIIGASQSVYGGDPFVIRYTQSGSDYTFFAQEDTSHDSETVHGKGEDLAYWFFEQEPIMALIE